MNLSIFLLAAGLGERLRPITDHIPKPLLPILGEPVLQIILERLSKLPVNRIGINLHHKKEVLETWIKKSDFSEMIEFFPEDPILGTGGALKNAEAFLNSTHFLVHNSDILSDTNLEKLIEFHLLSENLITLAVHDYPEFNNVAIDEKGLLLGVGKTKKFKSDNMRRLAFTGLAVYSPEFLNFLPYGASSVVDAWVKAINAGHKIGTLDVTGSYWSDIGTPASYARAVIHELKKNGETIYIHPSAEWCKHVELDGYVVIEKGSKTAGGISLRNSILLPGTKIEIKNDDAPAECLLTLFWVKGQRNDSPVPAGSFENSILGPGFQIELNESEIFGKAEGKRAILIGMGGSDRKYFRIKKDNRSQVLMQCREDDPDFQRQVEYTQFFQKHSIPVPSLMEVQPDKMSAFFEDLGDLSLYSWLKCPRGEDQIAKMYKRVIDILILIHTTATEHVSECTLLENRIFDYEYLRWETSYFVERFVEGIRNIRVKNLSALSNDFHRLAEKVNSFPKTLIHRDFQSQNIMITHGGIPRIVDYQGARIGPSAYDLVSILWDPYYRLQDNTRKKLLEYYINQVIPSQSHFSKGRLRGITKNEFGETLLLCRLQRHMQALGAYGFLSKVKGKKYFLKYVPEGLRLLKEDVNIAKGEYPELHELVLEL